MKKSQSQARVLVTGGAGFIGSHLCERLVNDGAQVTAVDNFITGSEENIKGIIHESNFTLIEADVSKPPESYIKQEFDYIYHLASPASPKAYRHNPVATYSVNAFGTHYLVEHAYISGAKFLFASTSEAYGDPLEHPQVEGYWGNVNPIGPRACYDVSKRFGEMAVSTFVRRYEANAVIVRIFNTYGPRMALDDGRVIPTFITQSLANQPMTIYGSGEQTRSYCYVDDLVEYLVLSMFSDESKGEVINIGNPDEHTILQTAEIVKRMTKSDSEFEFSDRPEDDPNQRKPDISKAESMLKYSPKVGFEEGLEKTIEYFRSIES